MTLATLISAVTLLVLAYHVVKNIFKKSNIKLPSGPPGIPILGNTLQMFTTYPHLKLTQWAQQYGEMFTIHLGSRPALVINDAKVLKQLFSLSPATGKYKTDTFLLITRGLYGVVMTEGKQHSEQRTACLKAMKTVGFGGKKATASPEGYRIWSDIPRTCDFIESKIMNGVNGNLSPFQIMEKTVTNTLWTVVSGEILEERHVTTKLDKIAKKFHHSFEHTVKTGLFFLPWLRYLAPNLFGYTALDKVGEEFHQLVEETFEKEKSTWREDTPPRHVIDCYIDNLNKFGKNPESSFFGEDGFKNSRSAMVEMFAAAIATTSETITWIMYYLSWYPKVQEKLHQEIDAVIGGNRDPVLEDRQRMPYTEAVIMEALRYSSTTPLGLPHELLEDIPNFLGYSLPKGLVLIPNLYGMHFNKDIWGDPQVFRPERFLDENSTRPDFEGESRQKLRENLLPFQAGKRVCMGEQQAKDFVFLMTTSLYQRFQTRPDPNIPKETYFERIVGFTLMPKPLELQITLRH